MNRDDLQRLADLRLADAEALIEAGRWAAAYYLAGYAVECALKACVTIRFRANEVPEKDTINKFYTHSFKALVSIAGPEVKAALDARTQADADFEENWNTVQEWIESSRYDHEKTERDAVDMVNAVGDSSTGVLPWLRTLW